MSKYRIPVPELNQAVKSLAEQTYKGVSFHVSKHRFGWCLAQKWYAQSGGKKTFGGAIIDKILCRAYNAGLMDDIKGVDDIAKSAFGDLVNRVPKRIKSAKK